MQITYSTDSIETVITVLWNCRRRIIKKLFVNCKLEKGKSHSGICDCRSKSLSTLFYSSLDNISALSWLKTSHRDLLRRSLSNEYWKKCVYCFDNKGSFTVSKDSYHRRQLSKFDGAFLIILFMWCDYPKP